MDEQIPPRLCRDLRINPGILQNPEELYEYAARIPILEDVWDYRMLTSPTEKLCLLVSLRAEILPHPAAYFMDMARRQNHLFNNRDLFTWFATNAEGSVPNRPPRRDKRTTRCPACGSSFFGYPLQDHKYQECGFVRFVAAELLLQTLVANTHSHCGGCNSRSTHHDVCEPTNCIRCHQPGHKVFHNVCATDWGQTPEAFKAHCIALRIQHLERVRFAIGERLLAIPSPYDFVPPRIGNLHNPNKQYFGVGPLLGDAARAFGPIDESVYQWKKYRGLVSVDSDPDQIVRPWAFTNEEVRIFMILENAARGIYAREANNPERQHLILERCFALPFPDYPERMANPGRPNNLPIAARVNVVPPAAVPQNRVQEVEAQADENDEQEDEGSDNSEDEYIDASDTEIEDLAAFVEDATVVDEETNDLLQSAIKPKQQFAEKVDELVAFCHPDENGIIPVLEEEDGIAPDVPLYFEQNLQRLVIIAVEKWTVKIDEEVYSYNVPQEVVEKLAALSRPTTSQTYGERIDTWKVAMAGASNSIRDWYKEFPIEKLRKYHDFLRELATALSTKPKCYKTSKQDSTGIKTAQQIPTIHEFDQDLARDRIRKWLSSNHAEFALFGINKSNFPLNSTVITSEREITEEEEIRRETIMMTAVRKLDSDPSQYVVRVSLPSMEVFDHLLSVETPTKKKPLVKRIQTIQRRVTGTYESHLKKFAEKDLRQYHTLWLSMMKALRALVEIDLSTPTRLVDCEHEIIQGMNSAFGLALPTMEAFKKATLEFWLTWMQETLIPTLTRIAATDCQCREHMEDK